ncbi:MAG: type IV pilus twitching motility protein PilT [Dehalococcoidia bacterium]
MTTTSPAPPLRDLLRRMIETGSSDLHLSLDTPPVYRRHGALARDAGIDPMSREELRAALATVASATERARLESERELDKALEIEGVGRFRVNISFDRGELAFAFRGVGTEVPSIEDLGLPQVCERLTQLPRGLVLVTGPTGSGKSTTLASMIDRINDRDQRHIITIEDPIEFLHHNKRSVINQREVGTDTQSFATALRHAMRQDPDVILVGEMRDIETMAAAITAAETGHLVFATLHTSDCAQTIDRIVDAFPAYQQQQIRLQLSMVLEAVLSQVLIPQPDGDGRIVACEVMLGTTAIRNLIREAKTHQIGTTMATGAAIGMRTLDQALAELLRARVIARDAAASFARYPEELTRLVGDAVHAA